MAAHIEGKGCAVLDMTGLAQKGGAVVTHVRIADRPEDIHAVRLASGGARPILGRDLVVTGGADSIAQVQPGRTHAVVNAPATVTGAVTRTPGDRHSAARGKQAAGRGEHGGRSI